MRTKNCNNGCPVGDDNKPHVKFSALMVVCNETRHLEEALRSIRWCDEVVVVDVGHNHIPRGISLCNADRVLDHPWVGVAEEVREWAVAQLQNDWVVILDPDEVFPAAAVPEILGILNEDPDCAAVQLRFDYYFCRKPLNCCMWRGVWISRIVHRRRVRFSSVIHSPMEVLGKTYRLPNTNSYAVKHYWKDSVTDLFRSHLRYIQLEGSGRYACGLRFSWIKMIREAWSMFRYNFISTRGCFGGWKGWFLSFFMTWYEAASWFSLLRYEQRARRNNTSA